MGSLMILRPTVVLLSGQGSLDNLTLELYHRFLLEVPTLCLFFAPNVYRAGPLV